MKPAKFAYLAPATVEEALAALAAYGDDARPLAGGQSLVPLMNMRIARPAVLVDLNRVAGLDGIGVEGDTLVLGTMVRQAVAERDPLVAAACPLLKQTLRYVGPPATKNRGTVGGSLAHADPLAELPGAALVLGAELVVGSTRGRRALTPEEFYVAELTTALEPGEMLREIRIPRAAAGARAAPSWSPATGPRAWPSPASPARCGATTAAAVPPSGWRRSASARSRSGSLRRNGS